MDDSDGAVMHISLDRWELPTLKYLHHLQVVDDDDQ